MTIVTTRPTQVADTSAPVLGVDSYSNEVLIGSWQAHRELQDLGELRSGCVRPAVLSTSGNSQLLRRFVA